MTFYKSNGDRVPDHIRQMAEERQGRQDGPARIPGPGQRLRRFDRDGLRHARPCSADAGAGAGEPKKGGVLKVAMSVKDPKDPRTADWSEIANAERQTLEPLVQVHARIHLRALSARKLGRERRRHRIHAACPPGRDLEQWRHLQRRRRDLQLHPLGRQERGRQFDAGPHGHAGRRGDGQAARRRDHQGRRHHGQAQADQARHRAHPQPLRLSGAGRASQLRRDGRGLRARTRSAPARSSWSPTTSARRSSTSAARTANGGTARPISTASSSSTTAPIRRRWSRAFEAGEVHTNHETSADYVVDPRRPRPGQVGSGDRLDDRGAHQRRQQAL